MPFIPKISLPINNMAITDLKGNHSSCKFFKSRFAQTNLFMSSYFKDKVVVVTGGTDGIGKALVEELLKSGAKVATCGRDNDSYTVCNPSSFLPAATMVADVSNENDCRRFIENNYKILWRYRILINNAGISMRALLKEASIEVIRKVMEINFFGAVYCTKYALKFDHCTKRNHRWAYHPLQVSRSAREKRVFCIQVCFAGLAGSDQNRVGTGWCTCYVGMPWFHYL